MTDLTRQRASRQALWVTLLALLFVAMTSTVEVQTCFGACSEPVAMKRACCSNQPAPDLDASCCGCCDEPADEAPSDRDQDEDDVGCCVTIDFDLEQAPNSTVGKLRIPTPAVCWLEPLPTPAAQVCEAARPFYYDRGPPRIDQRTALRATQVLLI